MCELRVESLTRHRKQLFIFVETDAAMEVRKRRSWPKKQEEEEEKTDFCNRVTSKLFVKQFDVDVLMTFSCFSLGNYCVDHDSKGNGCYKKTR